MDPDERYYTANAPTEGTQENRMTITEQAQALRESVAPEVIAELVRLVQGPAEEDYQKLVGTVWERDGVSYRVSHVDLGSMALGCSCGPFDIVEFMTTHTRVTEEPETGVDARGENEVRAKLVNFVRDHCRGGPHGGKSGGKA